jgi:hypothetical protein
MEVLAAAREVINKVCICTSMGCVYTRLRLGSPLKMERNHV